MSRLFFLITLLLYSQLSLAIKETVTIVTGEWPPYTSQTLPGYGIDSKTIIHAFSAIGITVEFKWLPWKRAFIETQAGKYDGTIPWFKNAKREKEFYYSKTIGYSDTMLWYRKDKPIYFTDLTSLIGYKLGGTIGFSYGKKYDTAAKKFTIELARSDIVNLQKLALGRIDGFPCDKEVCTMLIKEHLNDKQADQITYAPTAITSEATYLLISKKHKYGKELIDKFNEGLKLIGR